MPMPGECFTGNTQPRFSAFAGGSAHREDAEDAPWIFCEVDARQQVAPIRPEPFVSAWLYRVAANHCWDVLRRRKTRQDKETDDLENVPLEHPDRINWTN